MLMDFFNTFKFNFLMLSVIIYVYIQVLSKRLF